MLSLKNMFRGSLVEWVGLGGLVSPCTLVFPSPDFLPVRINKHVVAGRRGKWEVGTWKEGAASQQRAPLKDFPQKGNPPASPPCCSRPAPTAARCSRALTAAHSSRACISCRCPHASCPMCTSSAGRVTTTTSSRSRPASTRDARPRVRLTRNAPRPASRRRATRATRARRGCSGACSSTSLLACTPRSPPSIPWRSSAAARRRDLRPGRVRHRPRRRRARLLPKPPRSGRASSRRAPRLRARRASSATPDRQTLDAHSFSDCRQ